MIIRSFHKCMLGPLTGGPQCRMSVLRHGNVLCRYFCKFHVDFRIAKCDLSNLREGPCHIGNIFLKLTGFMSHVDFKKCQCRPADFKGQGPPGCSIMYSYICYHRLSTPEVQPCALILRILWMAIYDFLT